MTEKSNAVPSTQGQFLLKFMPLQMIADRLNDANQKIARRAFEYFERDQGATGHDRDHWLAAERELFHPVHIVIAEQAEALVLQAEVPGFGANDLQLGLGPRRLTIFGKKDSIKEQTGGNTIYEEACSCELLRVIDLPVEVDSSEAVAMLKDGVLQLSLPKVASIAQQTRVAVNA